MSIKFGTDGWRAIISDEFTFDNVRKVAQAISTYIISHKLQDRGVVIGHDTRFLTDQYAEEIVKVLHSNGIPCIMADRDIPTPVVAFSVKDRNAAGAIMITASHNPPQYCGIKYIPEYGGPAFKATTDEIVRNLESGKHFTCDRSLKVERFNPIKRYIKHLEELVDVDLLKKSGLKAAYDPLWGTGRDYLDMILENFGVQVDVIHGKRDVLFGGITPEPVQEHLDELKKMVIEGKKHVGLSTDPDADRFGILNEKGEYVSANSVIAALFAYLVEERVESGSVIRSVSTTKMIDAIAEAHGIKVHETPVGFKYMAEIMLQEQVIIAGEESGGLTIGGHIPEKDGLLANLLVCEMIAYYKKPLSQIVLDLSKKFGTFYDRRVNLDLNENAKEKLMGSLSHEPPGRMAASKLEHVSKLDGVKMVYEGGSWILVRPSGTEPIVRVYYEATAPEKLNAMIIGFESYVNATVGR